MQVSNPNEIKIYNLSQGPTLPEWIANRKKKKDDLTFQRRVELIQDFEMPHITDGVTCTDDGHYILTHGVYKPRIRCYDVRNLSMKFERCTDSEIIKVCMLSEDYTKPVLLQADRYVEFHAQYGRYYRTRIPKPGRDFLYHPEHCELYFVGAMPEIHRLNLERGQFMKPLVTDGPEVNVCSLNQYHHLFLCGTQEGKVEAWDPRDRRRVGLLDVAIHSLSDDNDIQKIPEVTALSCKDSLIYGVGTSTGKSLIFDLRSNKPIIVKDQQNDLPIKKILFHKGAQRSDVVLSADSKILKLWHHDDDGKILTTIEPEERINDICVVGGDSGLIFMPSETQKVQVYYIPTLGIAPKWCHFLDNLTEELEENPNPEIYDNYKFVTQTELDSLGLTHLVGTPLLRAYMHGHFIDLRLYRKAKSLADPYAYDEYKKEKVKEKIASERQNRVKLDKLPQVNKDLASQLLDMNQVNLDEIRGGDKKAVTKEKKKAAKARKAADVLGDDRFKLMFQDPDFQIDKESEEYKNIQPVVESLEKRITKNRADKKEVEEVESEAASKSESESDAADSSSSDEEDFQKKVREKFMDRKKSGRQRKEMLAEVDRRTEFGKGSCGAVQYEPGGEAAAAAAAKVRDVIDMEKKKTKDMNKSLMDRISKTGDEAEEQMAKVTVGGRESTFIPKSSGPRPRPNKSYATLRQEQKEAEYKQRKKERRGAGGILPKSKLPPKFYMGKRVQ